MVLKATENRELQSSEDKFEFPTRVFEIPAPKGEVLTNAKSDKEVGPQVETKFISGVEDF